MMNLEDIRNKIQVPAEYQEAFKRVVLAGMKVLFSKETNQLINQELQKVAQGEPVGKVIGEGIAGLVLMLMNESKNAIPGQLLVPAGVELVLQAVEYVQRAQLAQVREADVGEAISTMINTLLGQAGIDPDKDFSSGGDEPATAMPAAGATGGGGMIGRQMQMSGGGAT